MNLKPDQFCLSAESWDMDCCICHHPQVFVCSLSRSVTFGSPQGNSAALMTRSSAEVFP